MTLAEALRIYDINLTVDMFIIICLVVLLSYGLLVGLYTILIMGLQDGKTKRTFIKYVLPRLHRGIVKKLRDQNKTKDDKIELLEREIEEYFVKLKVINDATGRKK